MSNTHFTSGDEPIVDGRREWAISRCGHGCVHLALGRITLTLSDDEFDALLTLLRAGHQRFYPAIAGPEPALRAH